jgi:MarR family transcriptional regulator, organic hydroperoxide resistance regulator
MSSSSARRGRAGGRREAGIDHKLAPGAESFRFPATVSRQALLEKGFDKRFRQLVYDLLTIAARMDCVREHLGKQMGISGPQYSVLMAVGQFQGRVGVGVTALAKVLHVSTAFVATETGKLAQAGLLAKRANPKDGRAVLLSLTRTGRSLIERNSPEIRSINDVFFGALSASTFAATSSAIASLVSSSQRAMAHLNVPDGTILREAAE